MLPLAVGLAGLGLVAGACMPGAIEDPTPPGTPETTASVAVATKQSSVPPMSIDRLDGAGRVGLYLVDPETLERLEGAAPITRGDLLSGALSPNGSWLVLNVRIDKEPDMEFIRVVDVANGLVVTEVIEPVEDLLLQDLRIDDDGTVFALAGPWEGRRLLRLEQGGLTFETVFEEFPDGFTPWRATAVLGDGRLGWFGTFHGEDDETSFGLMVSDPSEMAVSSYPVAGVTFGEVEEHDLGDFVVEGYVVPGLLWNVARNRALAVHADQPVVSVVDLATGGVEEHHWDGATSWMGRLLAWLIPPAHADEPSFGTTRDAVLSPDGEFLYVGTLNANVVVDEDANWSIVSTAQGVEAISTGTWELVASWDIPASWVTVSPDGDHVIATGLTKTETLCCVEFDAGGVFLIDTASMSLTGEIEGDWLDPPDILFSQVGSLGYITSQNQTGRILIVDLENAEVTRTVQGPPQLAVFGQGRLLVTRVR